MAKPFISVLIPLYNHAHYIGETIASVLAQTVQDFEVIVMDDGSTDDSRAVAQRFAERDKRVVVHHQKNKGLVGTMNALAAFAQGEFVATVDADDCWLPHRLSLGVADMAENPNLCATFCSNAVIDGEGKPSDKRAELAKGPILGHAFLQRLVVGNFVASSSSFIRKSALDQVGPFARDFNQVPDWDLWLRLASIGELQLHGEVGSLIRWDGKNMSTLNIRGSSQQQLVVSRELVQAVFDRHLLNVRAWANVHMMRAQHCRVLGDFQGSIDEMLEKRKKFEYGLQDYLLIIEGLAGLGRYDEADKIGQMVREKYKRDPNLYRQAVARKA